ncbi:MAG: type II toxin-antitoxin system prevent-host-death family antitoxin [Verrucomicrobiae bacterium]|nr:type II toxin-antitoxin system prevent-host-death family antitoxin [Verrucomicrobiae bacterium]
MTAAIQVSVRELHAHTGRYIRKAAARQRVIVTDHGKAVAEINPLMSIADQSNNNPFKRRMILPEYATVMNKSIGGTDSALIVSEGRDRL